MKVLESKCSGERILLRKKVPGNESSGAISLWGVKVPGSELAGVLLADSLLGAIWPGSKKAVNHLISPMFLQNMTWGSLM